MFGYGKILWYSPNAPLNLSILCTPNVTVFLSKSINYVLNIWRYAVLSLDNCIIEIVISMSSFAIPRRVKVTRISKFYSD